MQLKDVLYKTPEMTEEKLLSIIDKYSKYISNTKRLFQLYRDRHGVVDDLSKVILDEWDLIQAKKSYLTKSQREQINGLVGLCLIEMTKNDEQVISEA